VIPVTAWRTDEPCPVCGNGLTALDDGGPVLTTECRLCGWTADWPIAADGGEQ